MEQELERIFRLMALLFPRTGLHDAYVGVRSSNPTVRANALEFLDNVLKPELRHVLVPLLDSQVTVEERIELRTGWSARRSRPREQAVATLLASEDPWLRSCAVYAVGALQLHGLAAELKRYEDRAGSARARRRRGARERLAGDAGSGAAPSGARRSGYGRGAAAIRAPADHGLHVGVGWRGSNPRSVRSLDGSEHPATGASARLCSLGAHQPLDPHRQRRRDRVRARRSGSVSRSAYVNPISASSVWPSQSPALGALSMIGCGHVELARQRPHLALQQRRRSAAGRRRRRRTS